MKLGLFIVIDENDGNNYNRTGKTYAYTHIGEIVYQIGTAIPVIHNNYGCIGLGQVLETSTTGRTTTVKFKLMGDIDNASKKAYYSLYTTNAGLFFDDSESYGGSEGIIGGAIGFSTKPERPSSRSKTSGITPGRRKTSYNPFD